MVDLSGDLRLPDAPSYRTWYGHDHPAAELLGAKEATITSRLFRARAQVARRMESPPEGVKRDRG